jgi:hypothetical protein
MSTCQRCYARTLATTMSTFNTQIICLDCERKERAHPAYGEAVKAEAAAVKRGDRNFPGIGKPRDL